LGKQGYIVILTASVFAKAQEAAERLNEQEIAYFGEQPKSNFIYKLTKEEWCSNQPLST
jgi:hypothetical protein